MWHFQINNSISILQYNYRTLKTKSKHCVIMKIAFNGGVMMCVTEQPHKNSKCSESDNVPLNQSQSLLCKILLYLIMFSYFMFHIWDPIILPSSSNVFSFWRSNQGFWMVGFRHHLRGVQQCLWKTLSGNDRVFSFPLSNLISEFCF